MSAGSAVPAGVIGQGEITGEVHVECAVVIVGTGPAARRWLRSSRTPGSMS